MTRKLRVALVVQRYGEEVNGGSETLARRIAELVARRRRRHRPDHLRARLPHLGKRVSGGGDRSERRPRHPLPGSRAAGRRDVRAGVHRRLREPRGRTSRAGVAPRAGAGCSWARRAPGQRRVGLRRRRLRDVPLRHDGGRAAARLRSRAARSDRARRAAAAPSDLRSRLRPSAALALQHAGGTRPRGRTIRRRREPRATRGRRRR